MGSCGPGTAVGRMRVVFSDGNFSVVSSVSSSFDFPFDGFISVWENKDSFHEFPTDRKADSLARCLVSQAAKRWNMAARLLGAGEFHNERDCASLSFVGPS